MNTAHRRPDYSDRMRLALERKPKGSDVLLDLPREDGLDLLEWLGLERPQFGRIGVRELAPQCRRRLWPIPRNVDPARVIVGAYGNRTQCRPAGTLRAYTERLLDGLVAEAGAVVFG